MSEDDKKFDDLNENMTGQKENDPENKPKSSGSDASHEKNSDATGAIPLGAAEEPLAISHNRQEGGILNIVHAEESDEAATEAGNMPDSPFHEDPATALPTDIPKVLPVLPVRDVVIFNYMMLPLFVGREASVQAVDAALNGNRYLLILTQKDEAVETPAPEDLHRMGTVVVIMRMLKMPDGRLKLLVQGLSRGKATNVVSNGSYLEASTELLPEREEHPAGMEVEAMMRAARDLSGKILSMRGISNPEINAVLTGVDHPGRLADIIAANLRLKVDEAQELLESLDPVKRLNLVNKHLAKEAELASMQVHIQESAREGMDKAQREYYLREQLKAIRRELGDTGQDNNDLDELREALKKAKLPPEAQKEADKQLKRLAGMHGDSSESSVLRTYLEWLADLPWNKISRDTLDIKKAKHILDEDHYGLEKIKERILEYLSVRKLNPKSKGPILCFAGPPGVGKTSLGRSIARAMGRKFYRMSLGGMRDEAEIRGHRRTYVGAMPGRIIQAMKQAGTRNPVIMLDEIDKIGADFRGDPSSALLEVLDPEQNFSFADHYINMPFDLSKVMFICTANTLDTIPGPLRDRMEVITLPGYTMQEKVAIANRYLIDRQTKENGLKKGDVLFDSDKVIEAVAKEYTREAGLRNLEREIGSICRKLARKKAEGEKPPFTVSTDMVHKLLGIPRFLDEELDKVMQPGVALGLAWTPVGGEILHIEVSTMPGKGAVTLTGQLGDVMKESAQAAVSYARAHGKELGIDPQFNEKMDIHIHVPAGATPKDGPSAGVTLATALISALSGKPVSSDLCMTGEITLRGNVLPVGGIKEKILAAVGRGIKNAIIPKQNKKDLEDIPEELRKQIDIHLASTLREVLEIALPADKKAAKPKASGSKKVKETVK